VDVVLLHLLNWDSDERLNIDVFAPIGLSYIAASLEALGYRVHVESYRDHGQVSLPAALRAGRPAVIGVSATGFEIATLKRLSFTLKAEHPTVPIVVGGYCSLEADRLFEDSAIDVVVSGEGEETMAELVPMLLAGAPLKAVRGILYRGERGATVRTESRPAIQNLDGLPVPEYEHVPADSTFVRVYASRGCPYDCSYCEIKDFYSSKRIRYHSVAYVRAMVENLVRRSDHRIEYICFNDDEFLLDSEHLRRMASLARQLELKICFQTRTRDVVKHQVAIYDNRDVIHQIHMGVESFSQSQLDRWRKHVSVSTNRHALEILADMGISYYPYIILTDSRTTILELAETCVGLLEMPACPCPITTAEGLTLHPVVTPIERFVHLSRLMSFSGEIERNPGTAYLEGVWAFLESTKDQAQALSKLLIWESARGGETARIGRVLKERIRNVPALAERCCSLASTAAMTELVKEAAADFRTEADGLRVDHLIESLLRPTGRFGVRSSLAAVLASEAGNALS
jgi:hypothetical protein